MNDIPTDEIAINLDTGEARHWDRETVERKGWSGNWRWASELDKRDFIDLLQHVRRPDTPGDASGS